MSWWERNFKKALQGPIDFLGNLTAAGTLDVAGNVDIDGTLNVDGVLTAGGGIGTDTIESAGTLGITSVGNLTIQSATGTLALLGSGLTLNGVDVKALGSWSTWTPTYSASGSMTFTSVTTEYARYCRVGKIIFVEIRAYGTTGGTASSTINISLPVAPISAIRGKQFIPGVVRDASSGSVTLGLIFILSSTTASFYKSDSSNWGLGTDRYIIGNFSYEVA